MSTCLAHAMDEQSRLKQAISVREERLARLGDDLRSTSRELHRSQRQLAVVDRVLASDRTRFERDFDDVLALPGVRGIEVEGAVVRILTGRIVIDHENKRYMVGEFAIDMDLDRGVRIRNLNNTSGSTGWEHPHVQGTAPCLGSLQEGCEILLGQMELVPLVSLLLQFLENYEPSTAYAPITLWDEL